MPFAPALRPSIQVGLLKAIARRAGFPVDDHYFNVALAAQLGWRAYSDNRGGRRLAIFYTSAFAAFREESSSSEDSNRGSAPKCSLGDPRSRRQVY